MHLMARFRLSRVDLLAMLNEGRKRLLSEEDLFGEEIKLSHLKKVDDIFKKGLAFYHDPGELTQSGSESIFFRKDTFNASLNLEARSIVNKFEDEKIEFETLQKLMDFSLPRKLEAYQVSDAPQRVASELRLTLYPKFNTKKKVFLEKFIAKLADFNILVFEHVDHPAKIVKANINGFYLSPNVIVLKRNTKSYSREIFTLAHELGHYLLNQEEIDDKIGFEDAAQSELNVVEKWCNDFAFYFLAGKHADTLNQLSYANAQNQFHRPFIEEVAKDTHLSSLSLYTRLLIDKKIDFPVYETIRRQILDSIRLREEEEAQNLANAKAAAVAEGSAIPGRQSKPIISPLYKDALAVALRAGAISELEFCKKMNIDAQKIEKYFL
jgi:Zn-dependent peptidase ImmA (M78 family)